jgi:hypothetical protein
MTDQTGEPPSDPEQPKDLVDMLRRLAQLRDRDVLSEEEYQQAKAKLVDNDSERGPTQ